MTQNEAVKLPKKFAIEYNIPLTLQKDYDEYWSDKNIELYNMEEEADIVQEVTVTDS